MVEHSPKILSSEEKATTTDLSNRCAELEQIKSFEVDVLGYTYATVVQLHRLRKGRLVNMYPCVLPLVHVSLHVSDSCRLFSVLLGGWRRED